MARPGEVGGYQELLVEVWNAHPLGSLRPIDSTLARLRKRLGESGRSPVHLHTEYGEGLRFVPLSAPEPEVVAAAPAPAGAVLGALPWSPAEALRWLRGQELDLPLSAVVAYVGGVSRLLEQVVALGRALTTNTLRKIDPLTLEVEGVTVADRLAAGWSAMSADDQALVHGAAACSIQPIMASAVMKSGASTLARIDPPVLARTDPPEPSR